MALIDPRGFLSLILTLLLVTGSVSAQDASPDADELSTLRELVSIGEYEDAEEMLLEVTEKSSHLLILEARVLRETGRGADAEQILEDSAPYRAGDPDVLAFLAGLRIERGDHEKARQELERALAANAGHVEARTRLGLSLVQNGKRDEGRVELQKIRDYYRGISAKEAAELSPMTYVWMGKACEGLDKFQEAYEVMYSSAFDLDKHSTQAHLASGEIMLTKYNYPDARSHFRDALKRNPNMAEAHVGLAMATYLDFAFPGGNRFRSALQSLDSADFIWEDHPRTLLVRGHLAFYDENWKRAEKLYGDAIAQNPNDLDAQAMLASVLYAQHRKEEFEELCQGVHKRHPAPAQFYTTLANKLVDRFFYQEGADFARRAVEIDEDYWPAYVPLAINALRVGRDEEGRKWITRAVKADPYNVWAFNTSALVRHIDKNFTEDVTDNFIIRMRREEAPFLMPYLKPLMEEAKVEMERRYQVQIDTPVTIEDFSKHEYFSARSIGLPGLAAAGVCFGKMVTLTTPNAIPGNWGAVAIHEFAHVITLQKTGNRVPRWMTEGLSVYEEGFRRKRWTRFFSDEYVEAVHHGYLMPMSRIQGGFTKPSAPGGIGLAYYQGGQVCQYIADTYGFDKIVAMLEAYGKGLNTEEVFRTVLEMPTKKFDAEFAKSARKFCDELGIWPRYLPNQIIGLRADVEDHPKDADGWVHLGLAYLFSGKEKFTDCELAIGRALALDPDHADLLALMGMLHLAQGKTKTSIKELESALEKGTNYKYRAHVALGNMYRKRGKRDQAIAAFEKAIEIHPQGTRPRFGAASPYYQLSELLMAEESEEKAVAVLERLLAMDRDDVNVRKKLGVYYRLKGNWEKVTHVLADGVFIDPYDMEIHQLLADAYMKREVYPSALIELTVLVDMEGAALEKIYPDIAWCHLQIGNRDEARDFAQRALKMAPGNERAKEVIEALKK